MQVPKINGFTQKTNVLQILSYIIFLDHTVIYYFLIFPLSSDAMKILSIIFHTLLSLIIIITGYKSSSIDPSDTMLLKTKAALLEGKTYEPETREFYCKFDHSHVHSSSRHCKKCNRCVEGFDHHCKWINNCVGEKNYKPFFAMIVSLLLYLFFFLIWSLVLTIQFFKDNDLNSNNIFMYDSNNILGAIITIWITCIFSAVLFVLNGNLVLFHIFLIRKNLTTFEYIVFIQQRKDCKKEIDHARAALSGEKKTCYDYLLCLRKKKPAPSSTVNQSFSIINPGSFESQMERQSINLDHIVEIELQNATPNRDTQEGSSNNNEFMNANHVEQEDVINKLDFEVVNSPQSGDKEPGLEDDYETIKKASSEENQNNIPEENFAESSFNRYQNTSAKTKALIDKRETFLRSESLMKDSNAEMKLIIAGSAYRENNASPTNSTQNVRIISNFEGQSSFAEQSVPLNSDAKN